MVFKAEEIKRGVARRIGEGIQSAKSRRRRPIARARN